MKKQLVNSLGRLSLKAFVLGAVFASVSTYVSCTKKESTSTTSAATQLVEGLKSEDMKVGTGDEAKAGKAVSVHYTGWLENGTKFDSSVDRGQPFKFGLGQGQVIKGWDKGVEGMKVGGKRKLTISPDMGYGAQGAGGVIPPNATLVFDVELLAVE